VHGADLSISPTKLFYFSVLRLKVIGYAITAFVKSVLLS